MGGLVMIPAPPPLWATLCQLWHLDPTETSRFWRALYKAKWTESAGLRQRLVHFEGQTSDQRLKGVDSFVREHLAPQDIVGALEALASEGLLSPREKATIEEAVLSRVDAAGRWKYPPKTKVHTGSAPHIKTTGYGQNAEIAFCKERV
jgi:hypothetical protein